MFQKSHVKEDWYSDGHPNINTRSEMSLDAVSHHGKNVPVDYNDGGKVAKTP
jgi:hypothetical protein